MGVQVVTQGEFGPKKNERIDIPQNLISCDGFSTAYDEDSKTIYIPYCFEKDTKFYDIAGKLESKSPEFDLYFLDQDNFNDMYSSVKSGQSFKLYAINAEGNYTSYQVVFTTLPVVDLHGEYVGADERERAYYEGEITVWDTSKSFTNRRTVQTSRLEWHVRGGSSRGFSKKSWKLSLKDEHWNNKALSFEGLSADDDYILNAMLLDDLKVREKLVISLWNEMMNQQKSTYKMTEARYCEVIVDGDYKGLYLLQKRLDKKYLGLDDNDILLKGKTEGNRDCPEDVFDVTYANIEDEVVYRKMDTFVKDKDYSKVNVSNFVDVSLILQLGNMVDNTYQKNIFYIINQEGGEESINLLLWDTDLSFGVSANSDGFIYDPDNYKSLSHRMEYAGMIEQFPEMEQMLKDRWRQLRQTTLSEENIYETLNGLVNELLGSGVLDRDYEAVGYRMWGGKDSIQSLSDYIRKRLIVLDNMYEYEDII